MRIVALLCVLCIVVCRPTEKTVKLTIVAIDSAGEGGTTDKYYFRHSCIPNKVLVFYDDAGKFGVGDTIVGVVEGK